MKIKGNTVGTTMPRANWSQNNPNAAEYIKGRTHWEERSEATIAYTTSELITLVESGASMSAEAATDIYAKIGYEDVPFDDRSSVTGACKLVNVDADTDFIPSESDKYLEQDYSGIYLHEVGYTL